MATGRPHKEQISLDSSTHHILEECRMVLPGIQALFGFQLIVVFHDSFSQKLSAFDQRLHLISIILVTIAVALVMAPAAFHRQTQLQAVSERFLKITSGLLLWGMLSLAVGLCLEIFLITEIVLGDIKKAGAITSVIFLILVGLWIGLPQWEKRSGRC